MRRNRVAVLAGNYSEYRNFLSQDRPLKEGFEYCYIGDAHGLRGTRGMQVVLWGSYWLNPAYEYYKNEYQAFEYVNNQAETEWDD
jgi:hypothetical protein